MAVSVKHPVGGVADQASGPIAHHSQPQLSQRCGKSVRAPSSLTHTRNITSPAVLHARQGIGAISHPVVKRPDGTRVPFVTGGFTILEVTLKHRVENRSHRAGTARTGDFRRFSAAFAGPAGPPGAIDFVFRAFVWLRWQMP